MIRRPWALVALLSATATASYLCRVNVSVAGGQIMTEFGLTQSQMGRVFSAFLFGYALFMVPAGMLADRFGAPRVLAVSAFWWVAGTALMSAIGWAALGSSTGTTMTALLVLRFVVGVGEAPTFPAAAQGVQGWIRPEQQGRANGLILAAIGLGSAMAPLLLTSVMVLWGWRTAMLVSGLPALLVGLAWSRARGPEGPRARSAADDPPKADRTYLTSRSFLLLTASYTLQGYVGYIFIFWFYLYLVQVRHLDLMRSALLSSLPWILTIVTIPLGGWISDRLVAGRLGLARGRRVVPMVGLGLAGIFLACGAHVSNAYVAVAYLTLSTGLVLCVEGPFWATMMEIAGESSGAGGGVMNMGSNLGGMISPWLTPVLAEAMGWANALYVAAALALIAAILWLGVSPPERRVA